MQNEDSDEERQEFKDTQVDEGEDVNFQEKINDVGKDIAVIYRKDVPMVITGQMPKQMCMRKYGDSLGPESLRK